VHVLFAGIVAIFPLKVFSTDIAASALRAIAAFAVFLQIAVPATGIYRVYHIFLQK
jgi:hypothetical protein